ncbi:endonuclease/exonuclease/phosphatase family protein [Chryseobacterium sp. SIMBA_029]|uniref:endonuclease/exonuclease/phosphatase family protein n=1 Tax=Chryseobacterium sp. SIMBA_029 TaxID=3085772 RepID=UPI00397CC814
MKVFRLILLILHVGILFLLLGTLLNAYVPPKIFPWFNLLSLGFPFLMISYVVLTFFWIFSWKKRAFVFMLLGLFFLNPVKRWINYSSDPKETADLKIVSFNTRGGIMGVEEINKYLGTLGADVILLQENPGDGFDMKGYEKKNNGGGITVLTKYKIISWKIIEPSSGDSRIPGTQTDIEIRGKIYRFINVYLHPFKFEKEMVKLNGNTDADEEKVKNIVGRLIPTFKKHQDQIAVIRDAVENSPYPVILSGDFNSVPNSYEYYHLSEGLEDAFFTVGKGSATSFHDYKFPIRIDYVFSSKSITPISYKVDRSVDISDHYPVIATFSLQK